MPCQAGIEQRRARNNKWYNANKERIAERRCARLSKAKSEPLSEDYRIRRFAAWHKAKHDQCAKEGILYDLSAAFLWQLWQDQAGLCALSLLPMLHWSESSGETPSWHTPSIDRVVPSLGYVQGNVRYLLFCVNSMRGTGADEHLYTVARALLDAQHNLASNATIRRLHPDV